MCTVLRTSHRGRDRRVAPDLRRRVRGTCGGKKAVARESDKSPESGTEPLGPVAALRRIAFLLERRLAETYKVKAFRSAAATLLPLGEDEVRRRAEAGTLQELPGIGASTAGVITDAVAGRVPDYLAKLERDAGP